MTWQEIHRFDQDLTLKINSWNSNFSDPIWEFLSDIPVWIPMYVLIVAFIIWRLGWKKGLIVVAGALLTFAFCDQSSNFVKEAVARLRPLHDEYMIANGLHVLAADSVSFPLIRPTPSVLPHAHLSVCESTRD